MINLWGCSKLKPWNEIFNIKLFNYVRAQESLIYRIIKHTPDNGSIFEVGFGTGWTSLLLAQLGYQAIGIDRDRDNWAQAKTLLQKLETVLDFPLKPTFYFRDLFTIQNTILFRERFDLGFSDGLFEHFTDDQVIEGLQLMKKMCKTVIVDVPSWKERNAEIKRGDEIYRKNRKWKQLIKQAGYKVKKTYGSLFHVPRWYKYLLPRLLGHSLAPYFTTKAGFVI